MPVSAARACAVSQATGEVRLRWDPFITSQRFLDGATRPGKGVRTLTLARLVPRMVSEYVSYRPPTSVGMTIVDGPRFFEKFGGGWRFVPEGDGCRAVWKYSYTIRPAWLRPVPEVRFPDGRISEQQTRARSARRDLTVSTALYDAAAFTAPGSP